jgi:hypothetical protein
MDSFRGKLKLVRDTWYAWQMIPGYIGERNVPFCSPIYVQTVTPRKTGKKILNLEFINALYAEGVQNFSLNLKIIKHAADFLIAELLYKDDGPDRAAVISHVEFQWIERFCPDLWNQRPPSSIGEAATNSVSVYLDELFGLDKR